MKKVYIKPQIFTVQLARIPSPVLRTHTNATEKSQKFTLMKSQASAIAETEPLSVGHHSKSNKTGK